MSFEERNKKRKERLEHYKAWLEWLGIKNNKPSETIFVAQNGTHKSLLKNIDKGAVI